MDILSISFLIKLVGFALVLMFLRQGVKRKYNPTYYIALGRSRKNHDLIVVSLGIGAVVGFILMIISDNQYVLNIIIAIVASFIIAPILAYATVKNEE